MRFFVEGDVMEKYEVVKNYVYGQYAKIAYEPLKSAAYSHTAMVDASITMLAMARNLRVERAKIAAIFHDYAQFVDNCPHARHAELSAIYCHNYLEQTGLFKMIEIDDICFAISQHSKKDEYDNALCEALKDADVMARFLENPDKELTGIKKERLLKAFKDIHNAD